MSEQGIKVAIMGVENAGKTTIVDILTRASGEAPMNPPDMYPTKGVERKSLAKKNITIWDFGGQEVYRNEYLANPEKYFNKISFFYYVMDVQDYYRLFASYMYFLGIFQIIMKYSSDAKLYLLFHKMDPQFNPNIKNLKQKFLEKVEPFLRANNKAYTVYDTTIFNFNSLKNAFSQVL